MTHHIKANPTNTPHTNTPKSVSVHRVTDTFDKAVGAPDNLVQATTQRTDAQALTPQVLLSLQASHGNQFVQRLIASRQSAPEGRVQPTCISRTQPHIQRDLVDTWKTDSGIFGLARSVKLKAIDGLVAIYVKSRSLKGDFERNIPAIEKIKLAIEDWRTEVNNNKKRIRYVDQLEVILDKELNEFELKKSDKERKLKEAQPYYDAFHTFSQGMGDFSGRDEAYSSVNRFHPDEMGERLKALTQHRNEDGSLDETGITENDRLDTESLKDKNLKLGSEATLTVDSGLSKEQLIKLMGDNVNEVTGKTVYPELENAINPNSEKDEILTETMDLSGVSMKVTYNKSDVNFDKRVATLLGAVKKIQEAGFTVPALDVHLPKLGRSISVSGECQITVGSKTERAVYVAPNFMHISSENMGNPLDDKASGTTDKFKFLSTELDPSGVGTIVHEFGHALHYVNAPDKFHELWGSTFKGKDTDSDKSFMEIATQTVSEYGGKPREFVAEVFLGMVYGHTYSKLIMKMYKRFGGMMP